MKPPIFSTDVLEGLVRAKFAGTGVTVYGVGVDFWGDPFKYGDARYVRVFGATTILPPKEALDVVVSTCRAAAVELRQATGVKWVVVLYEHPLTLGEEAELYTRMALSFSHGG